MLLVSRSKPGGNEEQQQQQPDIVPSFCQICHDISDSQHFGANACRACAAFFRRTVAHRLRYVCRFEGNCGTSKSCRAICKSCRLTKCLHAGMDPNAVCSRNDDRRIVSIPYRHCLAESGNSIDAAVIPPLLHPSSYQQQLLPITIFQAVPAVIQNDTNKIGNTELDGNLSLECLTTDGKEEEEEEEREELMVVVRQQQKEFADRRVNSKKANPNVDIGMEKRSETKRNSNNNNNSTTNGTVLEEILRLREGISISLNECRQVPKKYPMLATILLGYDRLERQRDIRYNRVRDNAEGTKVRIFEEKRLFDLYAYWQNLRNEIEWVADMLLYFVHQYQQVDLADKLILFTNFWILFIILERNYNSYAILVNSNSNKSDGANGCEDTRLVFANGEIFEMDKCEYDFSRIGNSGMKERLKIDNNACTFKPWFKRSIGEMMPLVRRLQPHPMEIAFCFGLMFWRLPVDVGQKLSPEVVALAQRMVDGLYQELSNFYADEMPAANQVQRVAELNRIMSTTQILALQRKEEIILARTFNAFKVDIYMEEVFGRA